MERDFTQWGRFYGVGVGPGDLELLTIKAHRLLTHVPVIGVPRSRPNATSHAFSTIQDLIDPDQQEILYLLFPMKRAFDELQSHWETAVDEIAARLAKGKDVAFITIGDPFLYSTFIYLYREMRKRYPDVEIEVVPGITSINAASAAALMPLVDGDERLAIVPATYEGEKLRQILLEFDTVVLLKVNSVFDQVLDILEEFDLTDQAVFVSRCTSSEETIVRDIRSLRGQKLHYLSLLIVRKES